MDYYELIGLKEEPFTSSPNPRYLFKSKEHRECLNRLEIAIRLRRGLSVVLGRIGTGKSTLSRALIQTFQKEREQHIFGLILDPILPSEFLFMRNLLDLFNIRSRARSVIECKNAFESFLFQKGVEEGKIIVLIVDEGQNLTPTYMETLRNLLNYESNEYKLLQLVIFAQLDFLPKIARNPNFEDRITTSYMLNPLNQEDTRAMIEFRLKQSGWDGRKPLFSNEAYREIYVVTKGYPRKVTNLCHNCMIEMLRTSKTGVDVETVQHVVATELPRVEEKQRELATNRLLDIIRSGRSPGAPAPTAPSGAVPPAVKPAPDLVSAAATAESSPQEAAPPLREPAAPPAAPPKPEAEPRLEPEEAAALEPAWKAQLKGLFQPRKPREKKPEPEAPTPRLKLRKLKGKAKRYIGLDIGTSAIKMVELSRRDNDIQLLDARIVPIAPAIRKSQTALEMFQVKTIRELLSDKKVEKAGLHVVLPDQAMQVRTVAMPAVSAKERENAIKFQIKKELPFPLETADITYAGWNPKLKEKQDVEVLAADHRSLVYRLNLLKQSDLIPNHLTSFPAAASNLTRGYRGLTPDKGAVAVVDIGAAKTTITVLSGDRVALCRTIATGGDDFTAVLQGLGLGPDGEDLNEVQAEAYKKNLGLPPEGDTTSMRVAILMRPVSERISAEIARSLELYRRNSMGGEIQKVVLIGGGALMIRLARFLARNVGIEVEIGDPLARVSPAAGLDDDTRRLVTDRGPELMPALGVALDFSRRQNLLPQEIKNFHRLKDAKRVIAPAAAAVLIILIAFYSFELQNFTRAEQLSKVLKEQLTKLPAARAGFIAAQADYNRWASKLAIRDQDFAQIRIEDPEIKAYLKSLSNLVPENIYLERLRTRFIPQLEQVAVAANAKKGARPEDEPVAPPKTIYSILQEHTDNEGQFVNVKRPVYGRVLEVMGNVYPQGSLTDVQLVDFVFSLEKCGYFRDVAVDTAATLESGKVQFTILCGI